MEYTSQHKAFSLRNPFCEVAVITGWRIPGVIPFRRFETHDPNFPGLSELAWNTGGVEQGSVGGGGSSRLVRGVEATSGSKVERAAHWAEEGTFKMRNLILWTQKFLSY